MHQAVVTLTGIIAGCDADDFGRALVQIAANPALREKFGLSARRLAESEFSSRAISKKLIDLYKSIQHDSHDGLIRNGLRKTASGLDFDQ